VALNRRYLLKAKRRLETARLALERGFVCSAVSNCYYALFNAMQSVVGKPPKGSWTHGGLPKVFSKVAFQKKLLQPEEIRRIVELAYGLYVLRKRADYEDVLLEKVEAKDYAEEYFSAVERLINFLEELPDGDSDEP